ncbi:DUF3857 domain-containing protein [Dysgonomonas sp. HGC4]|uniref:DUF3857 domain-containing protein n=1 Tax=Dysgonomonas sp. HGC4 TaxID=1658009 RepID=UPI0006817424|nr:DUF3857 domain-containing protein [Dysgonomonas sp. HGC4]MBD8349726.1 DUF3857 domain-containing protein [Dysgonomonas sp. HGC4]
MKDIKENYKALTLVLCFFLLSSSLIAADDNKYPVANIPDSLKKGAYVVVRENSEVFTQSDINHATYKVTKVVTILSKQGDDFAHFTLYGDKFRELTNFTGIIRDASGAVVKKIKKSDLRFSSVSDDALSTDKYIMAYQCDIPSYPCTVEYLYQEKWKNGILSYPVFSPYDGYFEAIEKSDLRIETPLNVEMRQRNNFGGTLKKEVVGDKNIYTVSLQNRTAIAKEPLAANNREIFPVMMAAPADMCYDSFCGDMRNWNSYGLWVNGLLNERDKLSPELVAKLEGLVSGAKNVREKTQIIYDYLQKNTRYVSIQLGIGGYQPIDALTVSKMGFGDCKGLTNMMKAMLKSVGVESNYCVISMSEKDLYADFPNFYQLDHVILMVPQEEDSIWLECTSQILPFGYIHRKIAGHNAIIISSKGGKITRLPSYTDQENSKESVMEITVKEDGSAKGKIIFIEHLDGYEDVFVGFQSKDRERILRYINGNVRLPQMKVGELITSEDRSSFPSTRIETSFEASDFANRTGTRLFIPLCPLTKTNLNVFTASTRNWDIHIESGFSESDTITINIPDLYTLESLPKDIDINTPYGFYKAYIQQEDSKIIYIQNIDILSGRYKSSEYKEIKDFFTQITSGVKRNLVLKKI